MQYRKRNEEGASFTDFALYPDSSTMCFNRKPGECESNTAAMSLVFDVRLFKLFKNPADVLCRHTVSVISNDDSYGIFAGFRLNSNLDRAAPGGMFHGIADEIDQYSLDEIRINHCRQPGSSVCEQQFSFLQHIALTNPCQDRDDEPIDLDPAHLRLELPLFHLVDVEEILYHPHHILTAPERFVNKFPVRLRKTVLPLQDVEGEKHRPERTFQIVNDHI